MIKRSTRSKVHDQHPVDLCRFIDESPTPFHAVQSTVARLLGAGYTELDERETWALSVGDKRFVIRGESSIIAFEVGGPPADVGFRIVGAHTDSPNLRVKPNAGVLKSGYKQVGVEVYGGVLLSTWLDRDLSIAGRVFIETKHGLQGVLLNAKTPVARIPNLAIHLNRQVNTEGLVLNAQKHMAPVLGLGKSEDFWNRFLSERVGTENILGSDLMFFDVHRASIGGSGGEFIFAPRLDNLASCYAATEALLADRNKLTSGATRVIALYDHEEVGSRSAVGAAGTLLKDVLVRIVRGYRDPSKQKWQRAISQSLLVSADMAHAVHPNYSDQHEPSHLPMIGAGMVIKSNANQSYATSGETGAWVRQILKQKKLPFQEFVVRTDLPCGSTIGPITSAQLGIRAIDIGAPMLSMHSCREMAGTADISLSIDTLCALFEAPLFI